MRHKKREERSLFLCKEHEWTRWGTGMNLAKKRRTRKGNCQQTKRRRKKEEREICGTRANCLTC